MTNEPNDTKDMLAAAGIQTETFEFVVHTRAGRFFWAITRRPWAVLVIGLALVAVAAAFMPRLTKDTSAEAFISKDHPAVVYRDQVEEIFGLADPVIVAVINEEMGIFNPNTLNLIRFLTKEIRKIQGVDPERVTSLATENNIHGTEDSMLVEPFFDGPVESQEQADAIRDAVMRSPLYLGNLVARDGSATVILAELLDPEMGDEVFHEAMALRDAVAHGPEKMYIAGEGAIAQYLGEYVDTDARRVYPIIAFVIMAILFIAYRTPRGVALPFLVVTGALLVTIGTMAAAGVPYYIITSALPVILIAIGVADGIHIMGEYYEEMSLRPHANPRELVVRTMAELWHPVLYTSLTDAIGFAALAAASFMPPMRAFGIFAAVGVTVSCLFSLLIIPAFLCILKPKPSGAFIRRDLGKAQYRSDQFGRLMARLGAFVIRKPRLIVGAAAVAALVGILGATQLQINYRRIDYFHPTEEIYQADKAINAHLDGTDFLDIAVETGETEGLFNPHYLEKMEALQAYLNTLPHVEGTTSIVDYIKQMNRAFNADAESAYALPDDPDLLAQYFFLYSVTGSPDDFEEEIDYDYRMANIRVAMNSGLYTDIKAVVEPAQAYIDTTFNEPGLKATLAGRANITYHWVHDLARSHFLGVTVALLAVWLTAAITYRSPTAGLFAIAPVALAILAIYAVMGFSGIWLGVGTSMFAAIGIGISVNFAIHTLDRTLELVRDYGDDPIHALAQLFPSTGRALMFNFACVFLGFGVLITSQVPPLTDFGLMVAVAVLISFIASITVLPAMLLLFKPAFLQAKRRLPQAPEEIEVVLDEW